MKPLAILPLLAILIGSTGFHASVDAGAPVDEAIEEQDASVNVRKPSEAIKVCQVGYLVDETKIAVLTAEPKGRIAVRKSGNHEIVASAVVLISVWAMISSIVPCKCRCFFTPANVAARK